MSGISIRRWQRGFWWAHVGWVLSNEHDGYDPKKIADMARYPELRWLDRYHWVPTVAVCRRRFPAGRHGRVCLGLRGLHGAALPLHLRINSLAHLFGNRRFETPDQSRNNWLLALITFGEGWHNNHHFSMSSCRQGLRWWEIDITYGMLKLLSGFGIVRDMRPFRNPQDSEAN